MTPAWLKKIKAGDVLLCAYPQREKPKQPGPKNRPVLAIAIETTPEDGIVVAYGTSQAHEAPQAWHFAAQLSQQEVTTIFDFSRRALLPATADYFPSPKGKQTPVIAHIPAARFPELVAALRAGIKRTKP